MGADLVPNPVAVFIVTSGEALEDCIVKVLAAAPRQTVSGAILEAQVGKGQDSPAQAAQQGHMISEVPSLPACRLTVLRMCNQA